MTDFGRFVGAWCADSSGLYSGSLTPDPIAAFARALPKAELHLHLEGSADAATMCELAPGLTPEEVRARYRCADFAAFLQCFKWVVDQLKHPRDYALLVRRLLERLDGDNVRYAEVTFSAGVALRLGHDLEAVWTALREAAAGSPVEVRWIVDAVRQWGPEHVRDVAGFAAAHAGSGVTAFGIGGDEARGPAEWFADSFALAREAGLRLVAHAGETTGPESVWAALRIGAERIGHGIRAIDDPALVAHLRDHHIPLEISVTSNLITGAAASLAAHPLRRLYDAGVPIVLNTDDPGIFGTTLSAEYELAAREFGFSEPELRGLAANALRYAFR